MKKIISLTAVIFILGAVGDALALDAKDIVGEWALDAEKSASVPGGNVVGLMSKVTVKNDGTFEALHGTKGKWKVEEGKVLVTYENSARSDEEASMDGTFLKFPSPALAGQFCYLKKAGAEAATPPPATPEVGGKAGEPSDGAKTGY
ncbi:MAG: hypothetical protein HY541_06575 [Deltaproteobacteria bacterium]|nr:hypothetical protein [Deltaproteobacteria bacterium]